jgi:chemotaxis response regulator CheB
MNGIEFIKRLMPQYPLPIIVVSSTDGIVFDAMSAGAVDFVTKPDASKVRGVELFIEDMISKIKIAAASRVQNQPVYRADNISNEIKDYKKYDDIPNDQKYKIECARKFFEQFKEEGYDVKFEVQINNTQLTNIIRNL